MDQTKSPCPGREALPGFAQPPPTVTWPSNQSCQSLINCPPPPCYLFDAPCSRVTIILQCLNAKSYFMDARFQESVKRVARECFKR
ncbi:hypothetical protein B0H34DRAFT_680352 [Crassisporium funariophilum]|nr:hypothetical protein B0H34DRAFT_680352 [Crassisporium funariophilum]